MHSWVVRFRLEGSAVFFLLSLCDTAYVGGRVTLHGLHHRGSTGPAEPLIRTTTTTNMAVANFVVKTCNN